MRFLGGGRHDDRKDLGLENYDRLRQYARKTAKELTQAGFPEHTIDGVRHATRTEQFGFLGLRQREVPVKETVKVPMGWLLWSQQTGEREIYRQDPYSRRKVINHLLEDYLEIRLGRDGRLIRYERSWNKVFGAGAPDRPSESWENKGEASDSDLDLVDRTYPPYWGHRYEHRFRARDLVKETTLQPARNARRAPKPGLWLSERMTELRKQAGTYKLRQR
jgi:hypothetical protein